MKEEYKKKLEEWLQINKEQWEELKGHGVTEGIELELDYNFSAQDEKAAQLFSAALNESYGYESAPIFLPEDDSGNSALWVVTGTLPPTKSDPAFLDEWVTKLVAFGEDFNCMFEGWGAYPPGAKQQTSLSVGSYQGDPEIEAKYPKLIHVTIPEAIEPMDRWERYEEPLAKMLEAGNLGKVARSGSLIDFSGGALTIKGIEFVIHVSDEDVAGKKVKEFFLGLGAPKSLVVRATDRSALSFSS